MIKFENIEIAGLERVITHIHNPTRNWKKSDSGYCTAYINGAKNPHIGCSNCALMETKQCDIASHVKHEKVILGKKDLKLVESLISDNKLEVLKLITAYVDITAPLYWWNELDAFRVGSLVDSHGYLNRIYRNEFKVDDFSFENIIERITSNDCKFHTKTHIDNTLKMLNSLRTLYCKTGDIKYWETLIQLLPASYNCKHTIMINYQELLILYKSYKKYNLGEWEALGAQISILPYSQLITEYKGEKND